MPTPLLATKTYIPLLRREVVPRPRLTERLTDALRRKLTLISAAAGFGKTTLLSGWVAQCGHPAAWLSLDEGDADLNRFLLYVLTALQTLDLGIGIGLLKSVQAPQPPPAEMLLTSLLNDIAAVKDDFVLVLDDYHVIDSQPVDDALSFLLRHQPPQMHLVIATREDPQLPLSQLRARGQLAELRVADLRFTPAEAAGFLNHIMALNLTDEDITALETRTEGWIAGLQLAAISMQGQGDTASFIRSFTGSHHFVLDYLAEEVLHRQPDHVQNFLLHTSILDRMCGPLCDAVVGDSVISGQAALEYLERANLFVIPLDNERRWYRYHRLFADLLRQRLLQRSAESDDHVESKLHVRASAWYEANGLELEAFHHAIAANDIDRAARLIEGKGMPLHFRGGVNQVLNWLASQPADVLDARPMLWVMYASALSIVGQTIHSEEKLQAAEAALEKFDLDPYTRNLIGHIAAIRSVLALSQHDAETIMAQSVRALEYLHPNNLPVRTATIWKIGYAHQLRGERTDALRAYIEAIALAEASGNTLIHNSALIGLGNIQESHNQLHLAVQTYERSLQLSGDPPMGIACETHLGMARICYEWNDLEAAQNHIQLSLQLSRHLDHMDRFVAGELFLVRLRLAQDDMPGALAVLARASQSAHQHRFVLRYPDVAAVQVLTLLRQGNLTAAAQIAQEANTPPYSQARIVLAQGDSHTALTLLERLRLEAESRLWQDQRLRVMVLQALAYRAHGDKDKSLDMLADALAIAGPEGFIRTFIDEGAPMVRLLSEARVAGLMPNYVNQLLAAAQTGAAAGSVPLHPSQPLIEPLSDREREVLHLIAQGLSNDEIGERLFLALNTVKGHNQRIFGKLQVQRRTEAVARARELGLL